MADVKIFTSRTCGWAVRNYASLLEKGVEFDTVCSRDSAGNKTAEFVAATPFQKTPVLVHGNTSIFESTLINLYIDDRFPDPPLLPDNPADRIEAHKWTHYAETRPMLALSAIAKAACCESRRVAMEGLDSDLDWFATEVLQEHWVGPYFFGDQFSLVDIAWFTVFRTLRQLVEQLQMPLVDLHPSLILWEHNVRMRPSIQRAMDIQEQMAF